jgi:hypothetical protein
MHLVVHKSTISLSAGNGLFAHKCKIPRGVRLTRYDGAVIQGRDAARQLGVQTHVATATGGRGEIFIDGIKEPVVDKGGASFANDHLAGVLPAPGSDQRAFIDRLGYNVTLKVWEGELWLYSTKQIDANAADLELLLNYGSAFQKAVAMGTERLESDALFQNGDTVLLRRNHLAHKRSGRSVDLKTGSLRPNSRARLAEVEVTLQGLPQPQRADMEIDLSKHGRPSTASKNLLRGVTFVNIAKPPPMKPEAHADACPPAQRAEVPDLTLKGGAVRSRSPHGAHLCLYESLLRSASPDGGPARELRAGLVPWVGEHPGHKLRSGQTLFEGIQCEMGERGWGGTRPVSGASMQEVLTTYTKSRDVDGAMGGAPEIEAYKEKERRRVMVWERNDGVYELYADHRFDDQATDDIDDAVRSPAPTSAILRAESRAPAQTHLLYTPGVHYDKYEPDADELRAELRRYAAAAAAGGSDGCGGDGDGDGGDGKRSQTRTGARRESSRGTSAVDARRGVVSDLGDGGSPKLPTMASSAKSGSRALPTLAEGRRPGLRARNPGPAESEARKRQRSAEHGSASAPLKTVGAGSKRRRAAMTSNPAWLQPGSLHPHGAELFSGALDSIVNDREAPQGHHPPGESGAVRARDPNLATSDCTCSAPSPVLDSSGERRRTIHHPHHTTTQDTCVPRFARLLRDAKVRVHMA